MLHTVSFTRHALSPRWRDASLALVVTLVLTTGWAIADWQDLRWLSLPDTDDMMRLAQVRDWLAGQGFHDLRQYRIAPPDGSPMHWSRVNDLGIAGLMLVASLAVDRPAAELVAVITYPALLFFAYLWLSARIARRMWSPGAAPVAIILAAVAAPATALFAPGRIDHHALQVITVQCVILFLLHRPRMQSGIAMGVAAAISMGIGLETAPQIGALIAIAGIYWLVDGPRERSRLGGIGIGFGGATAFLLVMMRPDFWSPAYCDGFSPPSTSAGLAIGAGCIALAAITMRLGTLYRRATAGGAVAMLIVAFILLAYPACARGPYGMVSPFLIDNYIALISEAKGVFALRPWPSIIANGGLMLAATIAGLWAIVRFPGRWRRMVPVVAVILISAAITVVQLRGIYIGVPLCAALMAGVVMAARRAKRLRLVAIVGTWTLSAGIVYAFLAASIDRERRSVNQATTKETRSCRQGSVWREIDRYPAGVVLTSTNHAAYLVGATRHATVGASYHRNDDANMATYRYFLGPIDRAPAIARRWQADYVLFCPRDFAEAELTKRYPEGIAAMLERDETPPGLEPLPLRHGRFRLYRIKP